MGRSRLRGFLRQNSGLTLVELMVSVALFGFAASMLATLFVQFAGKRTRSQNSSELAERLSQFAQSLEVYVTNATEIRNCGCNISNNCIYDPARECGLTGDCGLPLLEIITEDSLDPGSFPGPECFGATTNPRVGSTFPGLIPRGCKKRIQVQGFAPSTMTVGPPAVVGTPGRLDIVDVTTGWVVLQSLVGTYAVTCGLVGSGAGDPAGTQFYFDIRVKARNSNLNTSPTPNLLEGWHPADPEFQRGTHRAYLTAIPFRNLTQPGLHYGKTVTFDNCTRDGDPAPEGNCCSRYRDTVGTCIPQAACIRAGTQPPDFGDLQLAAQWCCSHVISPGGVCR